ncbi:MAG: deoxyribonuclease IV [Candidatus Berkelbacteria bacterium]|nr:deoxyribonuclease IV [Candidatus Berkelbacteria bacterium]MCR4307763.1 deoxyribonuclease IV [Candidatus Berkelbacteria bacterium]
MHIGAHVSTSGGLKNAIEGGTSIGAEAIQIFPSAPLQWKIRGWDDKQCSWFKDEWPKHFKQVIFHGIYLTNLAASDESNLLKTKNALVETLRLAQKIGVVGTIFHPGSYVNGEIGNHNQVKNVIYEILAETPSESKLIFENSAGSTMGGKLEDLAWLLNSSSDNSRVGVCLDTCHAFAAGYDIKSKDGYEAYISEVERLIGLDKVFCWHLNDSKFELGAKRDRHENIGEGHIGTETFGFVLNDPRWDGLASYLEVPGFEDKGPDKQNIDILKRLRTD